MSGFVDDLRAELVAAATREQARRVPRTPRPAPRVMVLAVATAVMVALVALALGGLRTEPRSTINRPAAQPTPDGRELFGGSLEPGVRYRTRQFVPALSFAVPGKDWFVYDATQPDVLALQLRAPHRDLQVEGDPVGILMFTRLTQVYDPHGKGLVAAPADLYGWMRAHPDLRVGEAKPVTVQGVPGRSFTADVHFKRPARSDPFCRQRFQLTCTLLAPNASFIDGTRLRLIVLQTEPDPLVILTGGNTAEQLLTVDKAARPVLDSLRIGVG
jgi:hypothetical protein